jgi:superfamily II DNA or RNA helicase
MKNTPYQYQTTLLTQIESLRQSSPLPIVLAASCGSGKTFMSINFIESFLKQVPTAKVLVLAHGQTILRSQYHANLLDQKPAFTFKEITKGKQLDKYYSKKQVFVTLPQTLQRVDIPHFDLVVVDEAHQRYFAKQVEDIIKAAAPAHQLLLTGTPSPFIARNTPTKTEFNILTLPMADLLVNGAITDVLVELASTTYPISGEDYNQEGNLKEDFKFEDLDTVTTLDKLLDKIHKRLKSVIKNNPTLYSAMPTISDWLSVLSSLEKTMFACHSQEQARQVAAYFNSKGVNTALSTSDDDLEAEEVDRFVNDKDCQVLIVVGRGVLGFNFESLVNVVDMTGSQNIDRIFQLMARVVRKHPKGYKKLFFKIVPKTMASYFEHLMTGVLCLTNKIWYEKYNGNNFMQLPLPIVRTVHKLSDISKITKTKDRSKQQSKPVEYVGLPAIQLFADITHKDHSEFNSYEWTTLGKVREKLIGISYRNSKEVKQHILDFILTNKSLPATGKNATFEEKSLASSMRAYIKEGSPTFDTNFKIVFENLCKNLGVSLLSSADIKKQAILEFIKWHGRKPQRVTK